MKAGIGPAWPTAPGYSPTKASGAAHAAGPPVRAATARARMARAASDPPSRRLRETPSARARATRAAAAARATGRATRAAPRSRPGCQNRYDGQLWYQGQLGTENGTPPKWRMLRVPASPIATRQPAATAVAARTGRPLVGRSPAGLGNRASTFMACPRVYRERPSGA